MAEARKQELQAKGMPPLPAVSTIPGSRRWEALGQQALLLLQSIQEELPAYYDERTELWHGSQRGEGMAGRLEAAPAGVAAVWGLGPRVADGPNSGRAPKRA